MTMRLFGPQRLYRQATLLTNLSAWLVLAGLAASTPAVADGGARPAGPDCVILLHGLARTSSSMKEMEAALTDDGYHVVNESYPSRKHAIEELAPLAIDAGLKECGELRGKQQVHFVTHSLGGILVRYYFAGRAFRRLGRVGDRKSVV